jgi:hypothetical protein
MNVARVAGRELGRRVELVSMDRHHADISVGLYLRGGERGPVATVHSYSGRAGTDERLAQIAAIMGELGGLEQVSEAELRFPCADWHGTAAKRLFLEACKQDPSEAIEARPLSAPDTRTEQTIAIEPLGDGAYRVTAAAVEEGATSRAPAIGKAMAKLAELSLEEGDEPVVRFACGSDHHQLIGLLLGRAQNLRAVLREEEMQASRGVLAAPSAQE